MMDVSRRLQTAEAAGADPNELAIARDHLYRGQCNCPYWHGAFGGIYLPHLRNAIFHHLITADNILQRLLDRPAVNESENSLSVDATSPTSSPAIATASDFDFDGMQEVRLVERSSVRLGSTRSRRTDL